MLRRGDVEKRRCAGVVVLVTWKIVTYAVFFFVKYEKILMIL